MEKGRLSNLAHFHLCCQAAAPAFGSCRHKARNAGFSTPAVPVKSHPEMGLHSLVDFDEGALVGAFARLVPVSEGEASTGLWPVSHEAGLGALSYGAA